MSADFLDTNLSVSLFDQRDPDLDPQLVRRGKDRQDWSGRVVQAPPLFIQEKIHPKVLIDDLMRENHRGTDVELKEVVRLDPIHDARLLTYLKLAGLRYGSLLNFNVPVLKQVFVGS